SLNVFENEIVALLGANGAGKTTLLESVLGLVHPRKGEIYVDGDNIRGLETEKIVTKNISLVPEHRQVFDTLTVLDNLYLGSYHHYKQSGRKDVQKDIKRMFELFPILKERKQQLAGTLSGGQQQMLAIARAMMAR